MTTRYCCPPTFLTFCQASVEQDAPGINIYPRRGKKTILPLFSWDPKTSPLCYPLLFPYGEQALIEDISIDERRKEEEIRQEEIKAQQNYINLKMKARRIEEGGELTTDLKALKN